MKQDDLENLVGQLLERVEALETRVSVLPPRDGVFYGAATFADLADVFRQAEYETYKTADKPWPALERMRAWLLSVGVDVRKEV